MKNKALIICTLCSVLCVLSVQAQELLNYPIDTVNGMEVYRYEAEKSIGLYRISANFGVPQSEIIRLNPQLKERGLHFGETLIIPTRRPVIIESAPVVVKTVVTESRPETDTIELALMLPFESTQTKRSSNSERMMEFYQGALLALQQLQHDDLRIRLRVYDIERSERRINALCDSMELDRVQAVLGVVYPMQIARMNAWCEAHDVPLLVPFCDDIDLASHPRVLQFNASDTQEADSLCQWILARDSMTHCVAIDMREADTAEPIRVLRKRLKAHDIPCATLPLRDLLNDSVAYALDTAKENLVILHSDKFQHVRILLPHLAQLQQQGYKIRVVSQYSWAKEEIGLPGVYTSVFTSTADRGAYEAQWANYFEPEHASDAPRFDLLGYDLTRALVAWLQGQQETHGLQSDIRWQQIEEGGYQNSCVKVIAY